MIEAIKTNDLGLKTLTTQINKGKAKIVWSRSDPDYVYYTPVTNIFGRTVKSKEWEIKEEVATAKFIRENLKAKNLDAKNLAIDLEEVTGKDQIGDSYTVRTERAVGDLNKELNSGKSISTVEKFNEVFKKRSGLVQQILNGMSVLHKAGPILLKGRRGRICAWGYKTGQYSDI